MPKCMKCAHHISFGTLCSDCNPAQRQGKPMNNNRQIIRLTGDMQSGKSTFVAAALRALAEGHRTCLYVSPKQEMARDFQKCRAEEFKRFEVTWWAAFRNGLSIAKLQTYDFIVIDDSQMIPPDERIEFLAAGWAGTPGTGTVVLVASR